jgi:thiamine-monophosphate kinase
MNEDSLIEMIRAAFPRFERGIGIGDDAALVEVESPLVVTTDMLIEDIDFTSSIPLELVARKSLAVNLSDLAAMGAVPFAFLLSLGIPRDMVPQVPRFIESLAAAASRARIDLVGGDLSSAAKLTISITAFGRLAVPGRTLLRSGAQPGDRIFVSRPLGGSAAGLALLQRGWTIDASGGVAPPAEITRALGYEHLEFAASAIYRHAAPEAETELGIALAKIPDVTACIDVSDGLSTDLHRLCKASGTGATIEWERVPSFGDLNRLAGLLGINYVDATLNGGEEYALLFTSGLREAELSSRLGRPVYSIGRMTGKPDILLQRDDRETPLEAKGFDHFVS